MKVWWKAFEAARKEGLSVNDAGEKAKRAVGKFLYKSGEDLFREFSDDEDAPKAVVAEGRNVHLMER